MPAEVDVGWDEVSDAFVVAVLVVVRDKCADAGLEVARQILVFQQDTVLQGLMPALDFALGLRMVWCNAEVIHALTLEPDGKTAGDLGRAVVAEKPRLMNNVGPVTTRWLQGGWR